MLTWKLNQVFGGDSSATDDCITFIEYNKVGHLVAAGDRYGRVVIFEKINSEINKNTRLKFGY